MKWNDGLFPASRQHIKKPGKATGEPRRNGHNHLLGGPKMVQNNTQDGRFKCQFEKKMEILQFFFLLNQAFSFGIVVLDSKLLRYSNWGELGPF